MSKRQSRVRAAVATADGSRRIESAEIPVAPIDEVDSSPDERGVRTLLDEAPVPSKTATPWTDAEVAERAYSYWQSRGCQGGSAEDDWHRALGEIARERELA